MEDQRHSKKTPVSVAEEYRVIIEDVSRKGNAGISKIGGFIISVNDTKPGDKVTIRITKVADVMLQVRS